MPVTSLQFKFPVRRERGERTCLKCVSTTSSRQFNKSCIDVRKKVNKSSDNSHVIKNKTALHMGYKTVFQGTSDEYKSIKLKYTYLFV